MVNQIITIAFFVTQSSWKQSVVLGGGGFHSISRWIISFNDAHWLGLQIYELKHFSESFANRLFVIWLQFREKSSPTSPQEWEHKQRWMWSGDPAEKKPQKTWRVPTQRRPPEWDPDLWDPWTNNNTRLRRSRPLSKPHSSECLFPFSPKHFPWPDACLRSDGRTACQADPSSLTVSSWRLIEHNTGTDRKR